MQDIKIEMRDVDMSEGHISQGHIEHEDQQLINFNVMCNINKLQKKFKLWSPPENWYSDEDPLKIKTKMDKMFVDLNRPITALRLGILYNKYEIAKKLWIHYPVTSKILETFYCISMLILTTYAIMSLQNYDNIYPVINFVLIILFVYDIITRICLLFGCIKYDFIESRFIIPAVLGCVLWILGDPVGILLYSMSLLIIFAVIFKIVYYRFLWNLLQ